MKRQRKVARTRTLEDRPTQLQHLEDARFIVYKDEREMI